MIQIVKEFTKEEFETFVLDTITSARCYDEDFKIQPLLLKMMNSVLHLFDEDSMNVLERKIMKMIKLHREKQQDEYYSDKAIVLINKLDSLPDEIKTDYYKDEFECEFFKNSIKTMTYEQIEQLNYNIGMKEKDYERRILGDMEDTSTRN